MSAPAPPSEITALTDPNDPQRFLTSADSTCQEWDRLLHKFATDTTAWQALDPNIPASGWTAEQRATVDSVIPTMDTFADDVEKLGRSSANAQLQDFAVLSAQYRRAYAAGLTSYTPADSYLSRASVNLSSTIYEACKAVGG